MSRTKTAVAVLYTMLIVAVSSGQLVVTEVMSKSSHPSSDVVTGLGGRANADWFELFNSGSVEINLEGYRWDDNDRLLGDDYSIFPEFYIQPGEVILVSGESDVNESDGFRSAWGLPDNLRIISTCAMSGGDSFSGLSSGGDEFNLYLPGTSDKDIREFPGDPDAVTPIASYDLPPAQTGFSWIEWQASGTFEYINPSTSVLGVDGAFQAVHDGSQTSPPYAALDVASPGYVSGVGSPLFNEAWHDCNTSNGDFDGDGDYGCSDIDALVAEIVSGTNMSRYDLNGDSTVDTQDFFAWLAEAGAAELPSGAPYLAADGDLNGFVDVSDLGILNASRFTSNTGFCNGDFNADGVIDVTDYNTWNGLKFQSSGGALNAVPEPAGIATMVLAVLSLLAFRRPDRRAGITKWS